MPSSDKSPRIFLTTAAGNPIGTYLAWREGRKFETEMSVTYTEHFFELCAAWNATGYVLTNNRTDAPSAGTTFRRATMTVEHRIVPVGLTGLRHHLAHLIGSFGALARMVRFRPAIVIVSETTIAWFLLAPLRLFGIRTYLSLHTRLWPETGRLRSIGARVLLALNGWFLRHHCAGGGCASREILEQVRALGCVAPFEVFLPTYRRDDLDARAGSTAERPFRVLFAGRIEVFKGILDLLAAAAHLRQRHGTAIQFDICGRGGADALLRDEIDRLGLGDVVRFHGFCDRARLAAMYASAQAIIVPSRTEFVEGYAQAVIEGVLAGKPVVTSRVCPAIHDIGDAALEVAPDAWRGYADAIEALATDPALYRRKAAAAEAVQAQFFDWRNGWAATMGAVIARTSSLPRPVAPADGRPHLKQSQRG